jgi:hypothetical protein
VDAFALILQPKLLLAVLANVFHEVGLQDELFFPCFWRGKAEFDFLLCKEFLKFSLLSFISNEILLDGQLADPKINTIDGF